MLDGGVNICNESIANPMDIRHVATKHGCLHVGKSKANKCFLDEDNVWVMSVHVSFKCCDFRPVCYTAGIPRDNV